jgi:hypothetical protein
VLAPDLKVGRTISAGTAAFSAAVVRWPDWIAVNGLVDQPARSGWPLHGASLANVGLEYHASFDHGGGKVQPHEWDRAMQVIAYGTDLWVADLLRYRLTLWGDAGTPRPVLACNAAWFQPSEFPHRGGPSKAPAAMIAAVSQDEQGRLIPCTAVRLRQ